MLFSNGLYPLIDRPTRISNESSTLIDNIFTNQTKKKTTNGVLINDISDHLPIFMLQHTHKFTEPLVKSIFKRDVHARNLDILCEKLTSENWSCIYTCNDVNVAYSSFIQALTCLYEQFCLIIV